jgi:hypothetical protein
MMEPARLPPEFRKSPARRLKELQVGEEAEVDFIKMMVDIQGRCFLSPEATLREPDELGTSVIYVLRTEAGFEVSIPKDSPVRYAPEEYIPDYWVPVVRVSVVGGEEIMTEPAKLSPEFVKESTVRLQDLKLGESGWVDWVEMAVDAEYRCYIDPSAKVAKDSYARIRATRTDDGVEVFIPAGVKFRWKLGGYDPEKNRYYAQYWPVTKLTYEAEKPAEK